MRRGPANLVAHLLGHYPLCREPRRLVDVIASIIVEHRWISHPNFALEKAEKWEDPVRQRLRKALNELKENGRPTRVEFNSSDSSFIQGACFAEPNDASAVVEQKLRRRRNDFYVALIRDLSPEEFELLCRRLLSFLGVRAPHLTRRTADEGIDFYGRLEGKSVFFPWDLQPTIQRQLSIWIVGQAKHFVRGQAGTREVRELVGAVALGRAGVHSTKDSPFSDLRIRPHDPVFAMLVTGGTLSARAWTVLRRSGVVGVDAELLAAFLADREAAIGRFSDLDQFRSWLVEPLDEAPEAQAAVGGEQSRDLGAVGSPEET